MFIGLLPARLWAMAGVALLLALIDRGIAFLRGIDALLAAYPDDIAVLIAWALGY